jgi:ParB/RepB/Spo0J family partition protein
MEKEQPLNEKTYTLLPLDSIKTMPFNMRVESGEAVDTLAESIMVDGVLEPLVVRPSKAEVGKYEVVCGVRRLRAAQKAGLKAVPCIVREMDDVDAMEATLVENMERRNLSDYEVGRWLKLLMKRYPDKYPTQEALGKRFGISQDLVSRLQLHYETVDQLKSMVSSNITTRVVTLPEGVVREVRRAPPDIQPKIVEVAVKHELSAREVKDVVDAVTPPSVEGLSEEELMRRAQERVQKEREQRAKAKKSKEASLIKALAEWYPDSLIKFVLERIGYDATMGVTKERTRGFLDVLICSTEARVLEEMWQNALKWKK